MSALRKDRMLEPFEALAALERTRKAGKRLILAINGGSYFLRGGIMILEDAATGEKVYRCTQHLGRADDLDGLLALLSKRGRKR